MVIAQVTLIGIMSIKKSALSSTLLVPLCWGTVFFALYLEQEHYKVTQTLPSTICKRIDYRNRGNLEMSFLEGRYVQPALQTKLMFPDCPQAYDEESNMEAIDSSQ